MAAFGQPEDYTVDPVHTRVAFLVGHAGFSRAIGTFAGATGTLRFDEDDRAAARLELVVPVASLDLGEDDWNRKILDGTFFDAAKHPQARFVSTKVEPLEGDKLRVQGELTIRGVTQPVEFEARLNQLKRHPLTFRRTAGFSAALTLSRKSFGMTAWPGVVDDKVELIVELEAARAKNAHPQPSASTSATGTESNEATVRGDAPTKPADETSPTDDRAIPAEVEAAPDEESTTPATDAEATKPVEETEPAESTEPTTATKDDDAPAA